MALVVVELYSAASRGWLTYIPRRLSNGPDDTEEEKRNPFCIVVRFRTSSCHTFVIRFSEHKIVFLSFSPSSLFDWHWPTPKAPPHPMPPPTPQSEMDVEGQFFPSSFSLLSYTTATKLISCSRGNKTTPQREQERVYIVIYPGRLARKKRGEGIYKLFSAKKNKTFFFFFPCYDERWHRRLLTNKLKTKLDLTSLA